MPETSSSTDLAPPSRPVAERQRVAGIDESQPWRTADMQRAMERWDAAAEAGFDPYNHVGAQVIKSRVA